MTDGLSLREFLDFRLTAQDRKLEGMGTEIGEIRKDTNGRLRKLEGERDVLVAVNETTKERAEKRWKFAYLSMGVIGGGVAGGIGHALGWW